jgi:hypothetical protein
MNLETILAGYKARCEVATAGPWQVRTIDGSIGSVETASDSTPIAQAQICGSLSRPDHDQRRSNTAFIAESRELVPKLLQVIDKLREQRDLAIRHSVSFEGVFDTSHEDAALTEILTRKETNDTI